LAPAVGARALDPAGPGERAGVDGAGGDRGHAAGEAGDGHRGMAVGTRPVAELADVILAPARDSAHAGERTGVLVTGGDRGLAAREAGDGDWLMALDRGPVPELAPPVVAPAIDPAYARERAGVAEPGGDR